MVESSKFKKKTNIWIGFWWKKVFMAWKIFDWKKKNLARWKMQNENAQDSLSHLQRNKVSASEFI